MKKNKLPFGPCPCGCDGKGRLYCFFNRMNALENGKWTEPSMDMGGYTFRTQTVLVPQRKE